MRQTSSPGTRPCRNFFNWFSGTLCNGVGRNGHVVLAWPGRRTTGGTACDTCNQHGWHCYTQQPGALLMERWERTARPLVTDARLAAPSASWLEPAALPTPWQGTRRVEPVSSVLRTGGLTTPVLLPSDRTQPSSAHAAPVAFQQQQALGRVGSLRGPDDRRPATHRHLEAAHGILRRLNRGDADAPSLGRHQDEAKQSTARGCHLTARHSPAVRATCDVPLSHQHWRDQPASSMYIGTDVHQHRSPGAPAKRSWSNDRLTKFWHQPVQHDFDP